MSTKQPDRVFNENQIGNALSGDFLYEDISPDAFSFLLFSFRGQLHNNICIVLNTGRDANLFYQACMGLDDDLFMFYPEKDNRPRVPGFEIESDRYRADTLVGINNTDNARVYICSENSFLAKEIVDKKIFNNLSFELCLGANEDRDQIIKKLLEFGYAGKETVYDPKDFSARGEILDVFPPHLKMPIRIVFDFDRIESISPFIPTSQLTTGSARKLTIISLLDNSQHANNINLMSFFDSDNILEYNFTKQFVCRRDSTPKTTKSLGVVPIELNDLEINKRLNFVKNIPFHNKNLLIIGDEYLKPKFSKHFSGHAWVSGFIKRGFYSDVLNCVVISANDIFNNKPNTSKWAPNNMPDLKHINMDDIATLAVGDYVVHKNFGLGVFRGLSLRAGAQGDRESIKIEYENNSYVYVSIEKMNLIHRYLGSAGNPKISRLGSGVWKNEIIKTKRSVKLVADELLKLYANKKRNRNFSYSKDHDIGTALDDSFPFIKTLDQERAIDDTLADLDGSYPLDRLICGDVGFGKTEVALRAIMKAVLSGKQVVFLCPTTILADQHYITCGDRLGPLGVTIGLLSRFKTKKQQSDIIKSLKKKEIDVLVGTHRVLSDDVFVPELGLLIVDEEHRFGVGQKEKIRSIKQFIDVLMLSATPIPRTLRHSLVGIKDISLIQTPPKSRKPIETAVRFFDWDTICLYIDRELNRNGQVYFLHNDINSLPFVANKIRQYFPDSVAEVVHGQLPGRELEKKILAFFGGKIDILVCTTIIESGIDVSNANSIVINDAQNFGLSQLYQIRGRVGRGQNQAHCLLLVPKKPLDERAHRRLKSLEQFTSLGSGYDISMKDLEIRGAGSLFGYKQSGHISSVGFEMYCELLKNEVNFILGKDDSIRFPDVVFDGNALIEESYVSNPAQRLGFYNRLSRSDSVDDVNQIRGELINRFGKLPKKLVNLLFVSETRALYGSTSVVKISINEKNVEFFLDDVCPYPSVGDLIVALSSFASDQKINHRFSEQKNGRLSVVFSTPNMPTSQTLASKCVCLFSSGVKK